MATYKSLITNRLTDVVRKPIEIINRGEASFKDDLLEIVEGIQSDRSEMLANVRDLQLAAQLLLAAESERLATLVSDDDRIAALLDSSRKIADRVVMIDQEIGVAASRVPMVKKTEALVYGRVTDNASRAVGAVTVTLADEKGREVPGVAPVEVDSAGYYALVVPPEAAAALDEDAKLKVIVSSGAERVTPTTAPITLKPGAVQVHDVMLNDAELGTLKLRTAFAAGPAVRPTKKTAPSPRKRAATSKPVRAKAKRTSHK